MGGFNQVGRAALTVSTSSVPLVLPADTRPRHALIYVGGQPVRWRADGTDPTSTTGMYVAAGAYIDWTDPLWDYYAFLSRVEFIRDSTAGADATLEIAFLS